MRMSLAERDASLEHCHLQNLWPRTAEPQRLLGSYAQEGLAFVIAPDLDLEWCRYPGESESAFDLRVTNGILARRGLPLVSEPTPQAEDALAAKTASQRGAYGATAWRWRN
jgi:hypothetical protein